MFPRDPAKVISQAHLLGLISLRDLLRERTIAETQELYDDVNLRLNDAIEAWKKSCENGQPDFSLITSQEKHLRNNELENMWETSARFGNDEYRRIKSEKDGRVGRLNAIVNILGRTIRDYFLCMYPFPDPYPIGQQKRKTIWGYTGGPEIGDVTVAHGPNLAELDFADMIRSLGRELGRKAFIANMGIKDFDDYALLLIRRLSTFTDYVYTEGEVGAPEFKRPKTKWEQSRQQGVHSEEVLRNLVDEINALYGAAPITKPKPSVT